MKKYPVIVVAGATASGKTKLAVDIAKKFSGEIISADSMQIYKYMNIGTAKPSDAEKCGIPHYLMDFKDPAGSYSVADFVSDAHKCIEDILKRNKLPVVAGGTGLYINSLINDINFDATGKDENIRAELEELAEREGGQRLLTMLSEFDPESAKRIHPSNLKRIIRAVEYYKITGETISEHDNRTKLRESRYIPLMFAINWDRQELYARIESRVDIMLEEGLLEEVGVLLERGLTKKHQSMQGIGYKQLISYFRGLSALDESVRIIKRDSRRYAKRQLTWFRRDMRINWLDSGENILKQAEEYIKPFLEKNYPKI